MVGTGLGTGNELEIAVTADDRASGALQSLQTQLLDMRTAVAGLGAAMAGLAAGGLAKSASAAADFEQAMIEVQKVTDEETAGKVAEEVQSLANTIPLAQDELATIAADAGRFGVEGSDNIANFTESVAMMATATDLSAQEAGEAFSRLAELTDTPIAEVENLGSVVNELSNNFATSSSEIVDSMLRSSAALSQLGLSQTEISGMSAALNEVSESSQRAGTRLRRVAQEIMNPQNVEDLADALGMTSEEFTTMREESPMQLIRRMAQSFAEGGQQADALRSSLSTASRQAVAGLAQNLDGLEQGLQTSGQQMQQNTSLQREFDAATSTFNSRVQVLKNRLNNVAIEIGNNLLPHLTSLLDSILAGVETFSDFNEQTDGMAGVFILTGTAVAGLTAALWAAIPAAVGLMGALSPILVPLGAIAVAVGALAAAWTTNFGNIRGITQRTFSQVQELWAIHGEPMLSRIQSGLDVLRGFWNEWGDEIEAITRFAFDAISTLIVANLDTILTIVNATLSLLSGDWEEAWDQLAGLSERTLERITNLLERWNLIEIFMDKLDAVREAFNQLKEDIVGNSIVPEMTTQVQAEFEAMNADVGGELSQFDRITADVLGSGGSTTREQKVIENRQVVEFRGEDRIGRVIADEANRQLGTEFRSHGARS